MQAPTLGELLARRLKELRQAKPFYGGRQEDVAREMRHLGFTWTQSTVASIEIGRRALRLDEFIALCGVLREPVEGWLPETGAVQLGEQGFWTAEDVVAAVRGEGPANRGIEDIDVPPQEERLAMYRLRDERTRAFFDAVWPERPHAVDYQQASLAAREEAEARAARKFGITPVQVGAIATGLWGRSLTAERDARLAAAGGTGSASTRRGHVTRQLIAELAPIVERCKKAAIEKEVQGD